MNKLSLPIDLSIGVPTVFGTQRGESNLFREGFNPFIIECQNEIVVVRLGDLTTKSRSREWKLVEAGQKNKLMNLQGNVITVVVSLPHAPHTARNGSSAGAADLAINDRYIS